MKLQWLHSFVAFSDELNFTRAAQRLHISQPALHTQIRQLGEHLDLALYRVVGRSLVLTPAGERTAAFARDAVRRQATFETEVAGATAPDLVLSAGSGAYLYLLGEGIERFLADGEAGLSLCVGDREQTIEAVRSGRADLGVAVLGSVPGDLESDVLSVVGHALAVEESHRFANRGELTLEDLAGEELIVPPRGRPQRVTLDEVLGAADVEWRVAVEATGWELVMKLASLGVGSAVVNDCCLAPTGVRLIPLKGLSPLRYRMVWRAERDAVCARLRDVLAECA